jgi:N-acetylmuramic acid 6-phosphate etherase
VIVGIDAGQTGVRAVLQGGRPGPQVAGVRRMEGPVGPDDVADALLEALATVHGDGVAIDAVGVGLSGFELAGDDDLARIAARLRAVVGDGAAIALASDGVTSLLGALGSPRPGVVVASGTGVVVLGHDGEVGWAKVDGWGSLLGDDGSGFAVGQAGLRTALRCFDGRDGSPALRAAAEERWGTMDDVPTGILREDAAVSRVVASFAPAVAQAARDGDAAARAIWERAGDELAASAAAACTRLFAPDTPVDIARLGNLWDAGELLVGPFARGLARRWPEACGVLAEGTSLDGAVELGRAGGPAPVQGLLWRG